MGSKAARPAARKRPKAVMAGIDLETGEPVDKAPAGRPLAMCAYAPIVLDPGCSSQPMSLLLSVADWTSGHTEIDPESVRAKATPDGRLEITFAVRPKAKGKGNRGAK